MKKLLVLNSLLLISSASFSTVIYVDIDANGSNNGSSWTNAYKDLQLALDAANSGDTIWVAEGTYMPTEITDDNPNISDRNKSFHTAYKMLKIFGGFAGNETSLAQRNWQIHPTILSGDFNGDDIVTGSGNTLTFANNNENAYSVFIVFDAPVGFSIDGFTIKGGNADNQTSFFFDTQHDIRLSNGGGIATYYNADVSYSNLILLENYANQGGGIFTEWNSNASLSNITVKNCKANIGGGIFHDEGHLDMNHVIIASNYATKGGGLLIQFTNPMIANELYFYDNYASLNGSAIYYEFHRNTSISNAVFAHNRGRQAVFFGESYITTTSTFSNVTFFNNPGSMVIEDSQQGPYTFRNMICYDNYNPFNPLDSVDIDAEAFDGTLNIEHSLIQGIPDALGTMNLTNNLLALSPSLVDTSNILGPDNIPMTADDGLTLLNTSPCLGTGTATGAPTTDITGATRPSTPSMGAYELGGTVGLQNQDLFAELSVYPNPTNGRVTLQFNGVQDQITTRVFSVTGQLIKAQQHSGNNHIELYIDGKTGLYFIEVFGNNLDKTILKVVKQ